MFCFVRAEGRGEDGVGPLETNTRWCSRLKLRCPSLYFCLGGVRVGHCCVFRSPRALTFGYECPVHVGVGVRAGDAEVDVVYISFIMSVQYIGYLVPYKDKVQPGNWTTCRVLDIII